MTTVTSTSQTNFTSEMAIETVTSTDKWNFTNEIPMETFNSTIQIDFTNKMSMETFTNANYSSTSYVLMQQRSQLQVILGYALTATIAVTMVGMGCAVDFQKMKGYILKPTGVIVGIICQFALMPAVAFALAKLVQMDDVETIALLLVGSCPGGTTSNIATYWILGDMDLSITMTTVSTTLGLGMMPLLLFIYSFAFDSNLRVPFDTIGISLATLVIPITLGMIIRIKKPQLAEKILKVLSSIGAITILALVVAILLSYGNLITLTTKQIICAALFPGIGMLLGYGISSFVSLYRPLFLQHKQRRTICIETGVQNTQLAGAIIQLSFPFAVIIRMILFPVAYFISQLAWLAVILTVARIYFFKCGSSDQLSSNSIYKDEKDPEMYDNSGYESDSKVDYLKTKI